ncbi:hypothetical protein QYF61_001840 [Mycteria americana]|uniref:Uncharacterized protein n=1 Tax=Mycteria americana TaxID=33587 RepID=A0AAN7NN58_MYCAM|nr:hypothetical protein QYF61_001840 [Mycteria americana]
MHPSIHPAPPLQREDFPPLSIPFGTDPRFCCLAKGRWNNPTQKHQAEQPQLSQPVLIAEVLQPSDHLCGPPLDLLQQLHVFPVLRAPELDAVLQSYASALCMPSPPGTTLCQFLYGAYRANRVKTKADLQRGKNLLIKFTNSNWHPSQQADIFYLQVLQLQVMGSLQRPYQQRSCWRQQLFTGISLQQKTQVPLSRYWLVTLLHSYKNSRKFCNYLMGRCREPGSSQRCTRGRQEATDKFKYEKVRLDLRKKNFHLRVAEYWSRLPKAIVDSPSLEVLKTQLENPLATSSNWPCFEQETGTTWPPKYNTEGSWKEEITPQIKCKHS